MEGLPVKKINTMIMKYFKSAIGVFIFCFNLSGICFSQKLNDSIIYVLELRNRNKGLELDREFWKVEFGRSKEAGYGLDSVNGSAPLQIYHPSLPEELIACCEMGEIGTDYYNPQIKAYDSLIQNYTRILSKLDMCPLFSTKRPKRARGFVLYRSEDGDFSVIIRKIQTDFCVCESKSFSTTKSDDQLSLLLTGFTRILKLRREEKQYFEKTFKSTILTTDIKLRFPSAMKYLSL